VYGTDALSDKDGNRKTAFTSPLSFCHQKIISVFMFPRGIPKRFSLIYTAEQGATGKCIFIGFTGTSMTQPRRSC
jgi:hypothetical protein